MRIFLTGFMAAGKTTVGRVLADRLGTTFVDLDAKIEKRAESPVAEIFAAQGESRFRELEVDCLRETGQLPDCVVACGGGTPIDESNRSWMRTHGRVVFLRATLALVSSRLRTTTNRPLAGKAEQIAALFEERTKAYEECDHVVDVDDQNPEELAASIEQALSMSSRAQKEPVTG